MKTIAFLIISYFGCINAARLGQKGNMRGVVLDYSSVSPREAAIMKYIMDVLQVISVEFLNISSNKKWNINLFQSKVHVSSIFGLSLSHDRYRYLSLSSTSMNRRINYNTNHYWCVDQETDETNTPKINVPTNTKTNGILIRRYIIMTYKFSYWGLL